MANLENIETVSADTIDWCPTRHHGGMGGIIKSLRPSEAILLPLAGRNSYNVRSHILVTAKRMGIKIKTKWMKDQDAMAIALAD